MKRLSLLLLSLLAIQHVMAQELEPNLKWGKPTQEELTMTTYAPDADAAAKQVAAAKNELNRIVTGYWRTCAVLDSMAPCIYRSHTPFASRSRPSIMHLSSMSVTSHKIVKLPVHLPVALGHLGHLRAQGVVLEPVGGVLELRRQKLRVRERVIHIE